MVLAIKITRKLFIDSQLYNTKMVRVYVVCKKHAKDLKKQFQN